MSQASRERFAALMRDARLPGFPLDQAASLIAAETLPQGAGEAAEAALERDCRAGLDLLAAAVPDAGDDHARLTAALSGFGGEPADYERLSSSLLPAVLRRRRGLPILLSVVWTEVARRVDIPAYGVGLPGHFVVCVGDPDTFDPQVMDGGRVLVDPWRHGVLLPYDRARDLVEAAGRPFRRTHLAPAQPSDVVSRMLANVRAWAQDPLRAATRLWAVDLALLLPDPDPGLLRERGIALMDLGHYRMGARWLEEYAEIAEERAPDDAFAARALARRSRAHLN